MQPGQEMHVQSPQSSLRAETAGCSSAGSQSYPKRAIDSRNLQWKEDQKALPANALLHLERWAQTLHGTGHRTCRRPDNELRGAQMAPHLGQRSDLFELRPLSAAVGPSRNGMAIRHIHAVLQCVLRRAVREGGCVRGRNERLDAIHRKFIRAQLGETVQQKRLAVSLD